MIPLSAKTPAGLAGVSPSQRVKDLRRIGGTFTVRMDSLTEGDILLRPERALVVVHTRHDARALGQRVLLRELEGTTLRSIPFVPQSWVTRLEIPFATTAGLTPGTIVLYPAQQPEHSVVTIRHRAGWARTAAPWPLFSDGEIALHLREDRARIIRSTLLRGVRRRRRMPLGTVVACRNLSNPEPTVWIRTGPDYWTGSTRGVTASDAMMNYELDRRIYHTVWIPEDHG